SNWLKPCCGRRAALWQVCLLSAVFNCLLVACVILVVVLLTLELLIDTRLLQFTNASQFAGIIHWISLVILSIFFTETVFRIVVLGIWDYIENKVEVFDGAVIVLSLAPMVASTVANGPSSPWDAISLIITLRIWRVKRIIDGVCRADEFGRSPLFPSHDSVSGQVVYCWNRKLSKLQLPANVQFYFCKKT
ncbi:transmembrane protein 266 isoform X1, partial [Tachysurus ichikawai]